MTKAAALYQFWSSFGLEAYEENSIYSLDKDLNFPYLTYELNTDNFSGSALSLSASLWYRSTSWVNANVKAEEISEYIGNSGKVLQCDNGYIWINRGTPFSQSMGDDSDDLIKRKYLNIQVHFLTN